MELFEGRVIPIYECSIHPNWPFTPFQSLIMGLPYYYDIKGRKLWIEEVGMSAILVKNEDNLIRSEN